MASSRPRSTTNKGLQISVEGAKEIRDRLVQLEERQLLRQLGKDNRAFAEIVVREAMSRAAPGREKIVAGTLSAGVSRTAVAIRLPAMVDVNDKRGPRPVGMGTEFGAYHDRRRLEKNTGGRRTIVRDEENINKVIRRVENQTRMGFDTVRKKARKDWGATAVRVTRVVRGWNMFHTWKGNKEHAGYFLYPAVRDKREEIAQMYADNINRIWEQAA